MATERQVAANRRNAGRSTGPRSPGGKTRSGLNAYQHGLSSRLASHAFSKHVEELARQIAGDTTDILTLEYARAAAEAELERRRARAAQVVLIERASSLGGLKPPRYFNSTMQECRWLIGHIKSVEREPDKLPEMPQLQNPPAAMPTTEPERTVEAMSRILPELMNLAKYEARAARRRDRAIQALSNKTQFEEV
jgi:hypothetical protein